MSGDVDAAAETIRAAFRSSAEVRYPATAALDELVAEVERLNAECDNLTAYCDRLRAERDAAREQRDKAREDLQETVQLSEAREQRLQEALEIAAPYIDRRSERGQGAWALVASTLGTEVVQRLGLLDPVARAALAATDQECGPRRTKTSEVGFVPDTKEGTDGGRAAATDQECGPRFSTASEVGSVPDTQEGTYEGRTAATDPQPPPNENPQRRDR